VPRLSTYPRACVPGYSLGGFSAGTATATFSAYQAQGSRHLGVVDGGAAGQSADFAVVAAPAATLVPILSAAATVAGSPLDVTVIAYDLYANTATSYRGTIHLGSSDGAAGLAGDYTFGVVDAGSHAFTAGVTFHTTGPQTVTSTDTATGSITGTIHGQRAPPRRAAGSRGSKKQVATRPVGMRVRAVAS